MDTGLAARERALVVLARYPEPGEVKSRLAASIGAEAAAEVYRAFLLDIGRRLGSDPRWTFHWAFWPEDSAFMTEIARGSSAFPQSTGDLGDRMAGAIATMFAAGFRDVVLIGSDVPHVEIGAIADAFEQIAAGAPLVLGPAEDGGYYLVGAHERVPPVFAGIVWGREDVLAETLRAAERAGISARLVARAYDVDTLGDLQQLIRDLGRGVAADLAATRAALERLPRLRYNDGSFMVGGSESSREVAGADANESRSPNGPSVMPSSATVWQDLRAASSTLTILGQPTDAGRLPIGTSGAFFPVVGLVIGVLVSLLDWVLRTFLSQEITSVLLVAVLAVASAGRQLDGFANTCDGLIGFRGREWAIATMRDRRLGSFGVAAIAFLLILKIRSFDLLSDPYRFAGIVLPPMIARAAIVALAHRSRAAAPQGEPELYDRAITQREFGFATALTVITTIIVGGALGLLVAVIATLVTIGLRLYYDRRLGGVTGHTLDAAAEAIETVTLLVFALAS